MSLISVVHSVPLGTEALLHLEGGLKYFVWSGIALYVIVVLLIGILCTKKVKDVGDFVVAGRRLPLWMATATLLATWFGAGSSMGVAATVYSGGLRDVLADPFGAGISLILAGIFLVGILRKMKHMTVTDIVQEKYGTAAGVYASLWMIPVYIGWLGAQVLGIGVLLNVLTGVDILSAQLIGAAIVLIYTATGGMWAVTLTDLVQVALIVAGLILILPGAIHMSGGMEAVFNNPDVDYSLLPPKGTTGFQDWVYYIGSWIIMGLGCMVGQDLMQRSLASKNAKVAVSSSVMAGIFYLTIAIIPITIGLAAKILLPKWGILESSFNGGSIDNYVMPHVAIGVLGNAHPVILTLFLSALLSAIMSSADSSLLAASSLFVRNVLHPLCPKMPDRKLLPITRIATVCMLILATFLAIKVKSIYTLLTSCWASQLVIVFIPVIAAVYFPKATKNTIWSTMLSATAVWITYIFVGAMGIEGSLTQILSTDEFEYILTCGSVYGFFAGLVAFFASYWGEQLVVKVFPEIEDDKD